MRSSESPRFGLAVAPVGVGALLAGIAAWSAAALIAFRAAVFSSFDAVLGDRGDGRLIIFLHEHLYNALRGHATFRSPPFFYPQKNTLGYSDAFLLDIAPYASLRAIGCDPFLSFQLFVIGLSLCCFLASLVIGRRYLKLRLVPALCAAALVTFPNNLLHKADFGHLNFFALYYLPCIVLVFLLGLEDFPRVTVRSLTLMSLAALLFALLFATGYYTAWLFALTLLIAVCAAVVMLRWWFVKAAFAYCWSGWKLLAAAAAAFTAGIIPFVHIYAPTLATFGGRSFREYVSYAPYPKDIIDVGTWNLVWGRLVDYLIGDGGPERTLAVTPGMAAIFLFMAFRLRRGATAAKAPDWQPIFFAIAAAVFVASWVLTARIGTFSLFWLPYQLVPGAVAIRAGDRVQLIVNVWVAAGLVVLLQYWADGAAKPDRRRRLLLSGAILAFCLIEQINQWPAHSISRRDEFAWLSAVPRPPAQCRAFLIAGDRNDAMWIAWRIGIPTLNGSSGWNPPEWRLDDPKVDYLAAARAWIARTGLTEVCLYDAEKRQWSAFR